MRSRRDRKSKSGRKRGRPSLGPRATVKLYVRPDVAASLRELARLPAVPVNHIGQRALELYLAALADGGDVGDAIGATPPDALARQFRAHESAEREIARLSMGVPRS